MAVWTAIFFRHLAILAMVLARAQWLFDDPRREAGGIHMRRVFGVTMLGIVLIGCAGRDPQPIATVQPQDAYADCAMISAEIQANNIKVKELADEQGLKVAQNVAAGVAGIVVWPLWFAMDFKGAASKDVAALQARQQYLAALAVERCARPPAVASKRAPPSPARRQSARTPAPPPVPSPTVQAAEPEPEPLAPYKDEPH